MTNYKLVIPEEVHTVLEFRQRDLPGFATVNVGLKGFGQKIVFAWHLSILIDCVDLVEDRLPSPDEQKVLYEFEDKVDPLVRSNGNALFLARATYDARRELIWRVHNPDHANNILEKIILTKEHPRPFNYRMDEDPKWEKAAWYLNNASDCTATA